MTYYKGQAVQVSALGSSDIVDLQEQYALVVAEHDDTVRVTVYNPRFKRVESLWLTNGEYYFVNLTTEILVTWLEHGIV